MDSFDEIPAVLDERENSELIRQLSEVIFKFLKGARAVSSQGILASRLFRQPTQEFQAKTILEIRPFTEAKIIETLKRSGQFSEGLVHRLFKERIELVPVARNPFSATLISEYAEHNNNQLPANQTEMYSSYIEITLESCMDRIERRNLSKEAIINCSIEIADKMFQKYGLEAPVSELRREISRYPLDDVIDVLKFARLGRGGISDENRFSFVHRRFTEYFAVQEIIADDKLVSMESIPTDSQWRDALVLYCEVAEESKATAIAEFCWNVIKTTDDPQDMRVIHCMRFLRDAFKGRLACIQSFREDLAEYIYEYIDEESNMISLKLAVETVGLLDDKDIDRCIVKAMALGNSWINETAFKSCRHLPEISRELKKKLIYYIDSIGVKRLFTHKDDLKFSLSLSEGLRKVKKFLNIKLVDGILIFLPIFLTLIFLSPPFGVILLAFSFIPIFIDKRDIFEFGLMRSIILLLTFFTGAFILMEARIKPLYSTAILFGFNPFGLPVDFLKTIWLFSLLPLIPFYQILKIRYFKLPNLLEAKKLILIFSLLALGALIFLARDPIISFLEASEKNVLAKRIFLFLVLGVSFIFICIGLWLRFIDFRKTTKLNPKDSRDREPIHRLFMGLKTEWGRMRF
ncbi:MAG: hypothetical protein JSV88_29950, partial [Candidatus Aminicenantes bacterium]